jgi:2-acylglycerol O-acyltransferase 2
MSAAVSAPLNPEPSQPRERANHHLPPKSYAEATVEGVHNDAGEKPQEANGTASSNDANGSVKVNGVQRNIDEDRVIYDKHISRDGEQLTSIKPNEGYEEALKHDAALAPRHRGRSGKKQDPNDAKLASGRRAGAGWERSAWVPIC